MKTLDEIIKRDDYVRMNGALIDRAQELAEIILKKMNELDQEELIVGTIVLKQCEVHSVRNGFSYEYLGINTSDAYQEYHSLQDRGHYYACANDFTCPVQGASSEAYLLFLNNANKIITQLDELETKKCKAIEQALESTKEL